MIIQEIEAGIQLIESDAAIWEEANFDKRADAIDFLEFHIVDRIEGLLRNAVVGKQLDELMLRAESIKLKLDSVDKKLFAQLRVEMTQGIYQGLAFMQMLKEYTGYEGCDGDETQGMGYDNLDTFLNNLLFDQPLPETTIERIDGMIFYQQTPARIILELAERASLKESDTFFDIGSGLGLVAMLINIISSAAIKGIEYEPAYCHYAQACTQQLKLNNIEFINADARNTDYSEGTVFFMYTPFMGNMLQEVLDILQTELQKRAIRLFTYGPCSAIVAKQDWLEHVNEKGDDLYTLYEFRSAINA